ncbi:hypothetical protein ACOAKC_08895 [Hathewaya histolytica]|uniref:hypothetical protein n=1 Tax=Hathewaya histolytica TaxID=1498 RepID=UPI003B6700D4
MDFSIADKELVKIIGLPLIAAGRVCDLIWFGFGRRIKVKDNRGRGYREVAEYALHVQCPWRLIDISKIIVGSYDKYVPNSKIEYSDEFDRDIEGENLCDERLKKLFELHASKLVVKSVKLDKFGELEISFSDNYVLDIMPDISTDDEVWRFFQNGVEKKHLVTTGIGILLE